MAEGVKDLINPSKKEETLAAFFQDRRGMAPKKATEKSLASETWIELA